MKAGYALHAERRLLCVAARAQLCTSRQEEIRRLARQPVDWDAFSRMALAQRVYPAVYANLLATCPHMLPLASLKVLEQQSHQRAERGATLAEELTHLLSLLEAHGIRALPLKGPTLAQVAYGRLDRRVYQDLDLLIEPRSFDHTEVLLHTHGYKPQYDFNDRRKAIFLRLESGLPFIHKEGLFTLDLHLDLGPQRYSFTPNFDALWVRSQVISLGGTSVRTLGMEDLLQLVCWHGAKHRWIILKFVGDVAEIIEAAPGLDWDAVHRRAQHLNVEFMLHVGLRLAQDMLNATLPPEIRHVIHRDPQVGKLTARLVPGLFAEHIKQADYFQRHAFQLQMRGTTASKMRYGFSTLTFNKISRRLLLGALTPATGPPQEENERTNTYIPAGIAMKKSTHYPQPYKTHS